MRKPLILALVLMFSVYLLPVMQGSGFPRDVVPPKCEPCCDVNGDGHIDVNDAIIVAECFGSAVGMSTWNPTTDVIPDGTIDISDIFLVVSSFTA